jgi:exodeoxyribonuclease X
MNLIVLDIETSDLDPAKGAEVVELAWIKLSNFGDDQGGWGKVQTHESYIQYSGSMSPHAQAIHHIPAERLTREQGAIPKSQAIEHLLQHSTDSVMIAHNSAFDSQFFPEIKRPWICTLRSAKHIWPNAPGYSNQVLRYWLKVNPEVGNRYPHQAYYDVATTTEILLKMLEKYTPDQLLHLTRSPIQLNKIGFGKHRGMPFDQIPQDYLRWLRQQPNLDADVKNTVDSILKRG